MITNVTFLNKKVTLIHNGEGDEELFNAIISSVLTSDEIYTVFLIYVVEEEAYIHCKTFEQMKNVKVAASEIADDLNSDEVTYADVEFALKKTGCHPRELFLNLLRDEKLIT